MSVGITTSSLIRAAMAESLLSEKVTGINQLERYTKKDENRANTDMELKDY